MNIPPQRHEYLLNTGGTLAQLSLTQGDYNCARLLIRLYAKHLDNSAASQMDMAEFCTILAALLKEKNRHIRSCIPIFNTVPSTLPAAVAPTSPVKGELNLSL